MAARRHNFARAFSLIELVFVILLIAIACAIVLPHWSNSAQNYQLSLAARRIASDLAWAQSCANSSSSSVTVSFGVDVGKYQLVGVPDPDQADRAYTVDLAADPYHVRLASAVFGNSSTLTFNGFGLPNQGGSVIVAAGGGQRTVTVDSATGQITIQ